MDLILLALALIFTTELIVKNRERAIEILHKIRFRLHIRYRTEHVFPKDCFRYWTFFGVELFRVRLRGCYHPLVFPVKQRFVL